METDEIIYLNKVNEVYFRLDLSPSQAMELKEHLSFYANNYKYHPQFKAGFWNGKIYMFNTRDKLLPIGLLPHFVTFCTQFKYIFVFNFDRTKEFGSNLVEDRFDKFIEAIFPADCNFYPRYYQQEGIFKALTNKRGILQLPTGSGKSLVQYSIIRYLLACSEKILLIVPTVALVTQMFSDFKEYGWDDIESHCCLVYAGQKIEDKSLVISTWQSIYNKSSNFFKPFTALMIDECHLASGMSISNVSRNCINAHYRIGVTGTMPKDDASKYTILGHLGPILYTLDAKTLIDEGVLSKIEIRNVIVKYPSQMCYKRKDYQEEITDILSCSSRNKTLDYILNKVQDKSNILILVQRIEHLKIVRDYIVDNHQKYDVYEIYGDTSPEDKELIRKNMEISENAIIVSTFSSFSTGLNVKRLHHVLFYSSYKSEIKILQSIGRGLRTHETKDKVVIWDVVDDIRYQYNKKLVNNYSYNHWKNFRLSYYEEQRFDYTNEQINI